MLATLFVGVLEKLDINCIGGILLFFYLFFSGSDDQIQINQLIPKSPNPSLHLAHSLIFSFSTFLSAATGRWKAREL